MLVAGLGGPSRAGEALRNAELPAVMACAQKKRASGVLGTPARVHVTEDESGLKVVRGRGFVTRFWM